MAAWDDEEDDSAPVAAAASNASSSGTKKKSRYADEDASDSDPKSDWENSDVEEVVVAAKAPATIGSMKNKGATAQKIAAKESEEARKAAMIEARRNDTPAMIKERENQAIIAADLANASDLLGSFSISSNVDILSMECKNQDDFNRFSALLSARVIAKHATNPLYANFYATFVAALAQPLRDVDVRKTSAALGQLANAKQTEQREAMPGGKKKKSTKPALGAGKTIAAGRADMGTYEEALDDSGDYDDFM